MGSDCDLDRHHTSSHKRAKNLKLLLCATVLGLVVSIGWSQPAPDTILLPDSLGPLRPGYHLTFGSSTDNIYVASESSDILVVDGNTFQRIKRIYTGTPVCAVLLVSQHNKVYCTYPSQDRIGIIDCATNDTVGSIQVSSWPRLLCYSSGSDKLYCGDSIGRTVTVIDCATNAVLRVIPVGDSLTDMIYDPTTNKVYAAAANGVTAIACVSDSVVGRINEVPMPKALCVNHNHQELYVIGLSENPETVYVVSTLSDSVVARMAAHPYDLLKPFLVCNEATDRLYGMTRVEGDIVEFDINAYSLVRWRDVGGNLIDGVDLVCDTVRNRLFCLLSEDGVFGQLAEYDCVTLNRLSFDQVATWAGLLELDVARRRVLCGGGGWYNDCAVLSVFSGDSDSLTAIGAVPLCNWMYLNAHLCRNPNGKLYYLWGGGSSIGVGVIDEQTNRVVKQVLIPTRGTHFYGDLSMAYSITSGKLYCSLLGELAVLDGVGDSLLGMIDIGGSGSQPVCWIPDCNKLYSRSLADLRRYIAVVDCASDSVIQEIDVVRLDWFEYLGGGRILGWTDQGRLTLLDYRRDSILVDTLIDPYLNTVTHTEDGKKIYIVKQYQRLQVLDASSLSLRKEVDWSYPLGANAITLNVSDSVHKLYWCFEGDSILAVDTRTDTVVARMQTLDAGLTLSYPCLDQSQRYLFRPNGYENFLLVYDMLSDSLAAMYSTMPYPVFATANPELGRIYVGCPDAILVYPDTVASGICQASTTLPRRPSQAVVRGILQVPDASDSRSQTTSLLDATGRKVLDLRPGANDVRALAPGVYFLREEPQAASFKPQAVRKIVVTR